MRRDWSSCIDEGSLKALNAEIPEAKWVLLRGKNEALNSRIDRYSPSLLVLPSVRT